MAVFEIPMQGIDEIFGITINGISYGMRVLWNVPMQAWVMDLYDAADVPILTGSPLITGADLLAQYTYLHIGADVQFIVITFAIGKSPDEIPNETNLGTDGKLYYVTEEPLT